MLKRYRSIILIFALSLCLGLLLSGCRRTPPKRTEAEITAFSGASIEGKDVYLFTDENTGSLTLTELVSVSGGATWALYADENGQEVIENTTVALSDGNNIFYIIVTAEDKVNSNTYKLTVYKSYEVNIYFYDGDTLLSEGTTAAYTGKVYVVDYEPQFTGYTLDYWYFEEDDTQAIESFTPWEDAYLYAHKSANTYKALLNADGGEVEKSEVEVRYGNTFTLPVPTRKDHIFLGWYLSGTAVTDDEGNSLGKWEYAEDTSFTAHWQGNFTVTVNATLGGTIVDNSGKYLEGETFTLSAKTQDGYTWLGWFKDGVELTKEFEYSVEVTESATYTAKWIACPIIIKTQVSLIVNDGYEYVSAIDIPSKTVAGEEITLTARQTNQLGYEFVGWYDSSYSATGKLLSANLDYTFNVPSAETKLYIRYDKKAEMKNFSFSSTDIECVITSASSSIPENLVIPDYVTELRSSNTARGVFQAMSITSVVVGSGITQIPDKTFQACKSLSSVEFKGEVSYIGQNAFYQCSALQSVALGSALTTIDYAAFSQCALLSDLGDTSGVTTLGREAFYKCSGLISVDLPKIESIGQSAFNQCTSLEGIKLGIITGTAIESRLSEMGISAFEGSGLKSITIPGSLTAVPQSAFSKCKSLIEVILCEGVERLEMYCFSYNSGLTEISLPDSVQYLDYAFYYCDKLQKIKFGTGVNFISKYTFSGCSALSEAEFAVTEGWVSSNSTSATGGITLSSSDLSDKATAAKLLRERNTLQNFIRTDAA